MRFILGLIINSFVLWISQIAVLPKEKEKGFISVLVLAFIGAMLTSFFALIPLGWLVGIIVWIWLIKKWFETGWFEAIAIAVLAFIILVIAILLLG